MALFNVCDRDFQLSQFLEENGAVEFAALPRYFDLALTKVPTHPFDPLFPTRQENNRIAPDSLEYREPPA